MHSHGSKSPPSAIVSVFKYYIFQALIHSKVTRSLTKLQNILLRKTLLKNSRKLQMSLLVMDNEQSVAVESVNINFDQCIIISLLHKDLYLNFGKR